MSVFKRILIIITFIFVNYCLLSQEHYFHIERMITDFRGVVSNNNKIICYGDYGIMTYSTNSGHSWQQQSFGDKYNIMKIETDGFDFFGVTNYFLFRSYNNSSYWIKQPIFEQSKIIDMTLYNNSIYILTKDGILKSDKEMNIVKTPLIKLNDDYNYSELKTDGINLYFIADSRLFFKYNLSTQNLDTIDILNKFKSLNYTTVSGLKIFGEDIYLQISHQAKDKNYYYSLIKSNDKGSNWIKLTKLILNGNCYKIIYDDIYFIRQGIKYDSSDSFLTTQFIKIDSSHYAKDSSYFTIINDNEKIKRYIRWTKYIDFKDFVINDDTIIAVGSNKLISVSYDKGKSFEFKSFFDGVYVGLYNNISILNDSLIYVINGYQINKTTNGGITWLPQKYRNYNNNTYNTFPDIYYLGSHGNGFAKYRNINTNNDSNALVTKDYGENFIKTNNKNLTIPTNSILFPKCLDLGDIALFGTNLQKDSAGQSSFLILRYDSSLKLLDSTRLLGDLKNLIKIGNDNIITLNLLSTGVNKADSNGKTVNYSYNYFLRKSTDKGNSWDSLNIIVPIRQNLVKNNTNFYYTDIIHKNAITYNNFVFYPTTNNVIYRFDYINNKFDSLFCPAAISKLNPLPIFKFNSKLFVVSNYNNKFYFTNVSTNEPVLWDSLSPEDIFGQWDNYNLLNNLKNKDAILSAKMLNDSSGFLIIGKSQQSLRTGTKKFKINFVKISPDKRTNVQEHRIEEDRVYLWNSSPYPLPGKDIIKSHIYWNKNYNIQNVKINVYDIIGTKINNNKIHIEPITNYSGILEWDSSKYISGIYFIQILLGGESISIPVIVSK